MRNAERCLALSKARSETTAAGRCLSTVVQPGIVPSLLRLGSIEMTGP